MGDGIESMCMNARLLNAGMDDARLLVFRVFVSWEVAVVFLDNTRQSS